MKKRAQAHQSLIDRASDITAGSANGSALIVAPHPDDEVIGCGALIARKLAAGSQVDVVILSDGGASTRPANASREEKARLRTAEAKTAMGVLGLPAGRLHFLGLEDGMLTAHRTELETMVGDLLDRLRPAEIYVTSRIDPHPDHQTAAQVCAALATTRSHPISVYEYPVWLLAGPQLAKPQEMGPVVAVTTGIYLDAKRRAFDAYESRKDFGPLLKQFFADVELFFPVTEATGRAAGSG
ncbi:MAG: PIG-L deacetylase family protein [Acidimicrobiia bacterium]